MSEIPIRKDFEAAHPVPSAWRSPLAHLAEAIAGLGASDGAFDVEDLARWRANIKSYGVRIGRVPNESWDTSVVQWMGYHWDVLVDLYTLDESRTDLAMSVRVIEHDGAYEFMVESVHVP